MLHELGAMHAFALIVPDRLEALGESCIANDNGLDKFERSGDLGAGAGIEVGIGR